MKVKLTISILALYLTLSAAMAQDPVPLLIGECATVNVEELTSDPKEDEGFHPFIIPNNRLYVRGNLCTAYSIAGWEETMMLYLGEGAEEYRDLIELAVKVWNEAVTLKSGDPLIEIVEGRPETYRLQKSFWSDSYKHARENSEDDESVIYFSPSSEDDMSSLWGLAWERSRCCGESGSPEISQADIYINTFDEEDAHPDTLVLTTLLVEVDKFHGAYAVVNKTYSVILHELGHAIGLKHIPVSGNIMSMDFGAGGLNQWSAPIAVELFNSLSPRRHKFVDRHNKIFPYMALYPHSENFLERMDFFTENAKVGEQERTVLTCIYEF